MKLVVYEDARAEYLEPLSLTRPVFDLRCGHFSLLERIRSAVPGAECCVFVRDYLAAVTKEAFPDLRVNDPACLKGDDLLLVNARLLARAGDLKADGGEQLVLKTVDDEEQADKDTFEKCGWEWQQSVVFARVNSTTLERTAADNAADLVAQLADLLPRAEADPVMINWLWNLVHHNPELLVTDFRNRGASGFEGDVHETAQILGSAADVFVGKGAAVHPYVVFDASGGPIYIDEDCTIHPFTRVEGPAFVGRKCWLLGTKMREGCSIGPVCRVGGEIEESIFHSFSSKYHDGFIGHAYIGQWVNLGALTTNSDLKNDYGSVELYVKGHLIDTRDLKVGSFIGDHTKTGLATLFNTGTVVGAMCNVLPGVGLLPKEIPSFSGLFDGRLSRGLGLKALLDTARKAMARRDQKLTDAAVEMYTHLQEATDSRRRELIKAGRRKSKR